METIRKRRNGDKTAFSNLVGDSEIAALASTLDSLLVERVEKEEKLLVAKNNAMAANEAKSSFLAMMGHEIRTPLHSIMGYADILATSELNPEQYKFIHSIQKASDILLSEINDLLDFSKIEAGKLSLENVDFEIAQIVQDSIDFSLPLIDQDHINISSSIDSKLPKLVKGDPLRLKQILLNLLSNSAKFTCIGEISIRVFLVSEENDSVTLRIEVSDTGIGLSETEIEKLFKPFTQADLSTTRKFGGTGLGLTICRKLTELMGGNISVKSTPQVGTTFIVELLLKLADKIGVEVNHSAISNHHQFTEQYILVAEDNLVNQQLMSIMLKQNGHKVDVVSNGAEVIDAVKKNKYDMVLMDVQMPVMDGLEATRQICTLSDDNKFLPIIAMTANAYSEDMNSCYQAGMNDFLSKPVHLDVLTTTVEKWVHNIH